MRRMKKMFGSFAFVMTAMFGITSNVSALELEDVANVIAPNDKIVIEAVQPTDDLEFDFYLEYALLPYEGKYTDEDINFSVVNCDENYINCDLSLIRQGMNDSFPREQLEKKIILEWQATDNSIKNKINSYLKELGEIQGTDEWGRAPYYFDLTDLNLINYYATTNSKDLDDNVVARTIAYSETIRNLFGHSNLTYTINFRAGSVYSPFETSAFGGLLIKYNDVVYGVQDGIGIAIKEVIYVPSDTELTDSALIAAANKRIKQYMPDSNITISAGTNFSSYNGVNGKPLDFSSFIDISKTNGKVYKVNFGDFIADFVIVADSNKMTNPEFLSKDMETNVEISSSSSSIPLDTLIDSTKLTSGDEYAKIIKLLGVKDNETYDLKLYSNSLSKYITKLDDGTFEVRIPISADLKNKTLVAYYVDEKDNVIEYEVKIVGDYAVFKTDHFSIYTLAEKEKDATETGIENPQTFDGISKYFILGFISLLGITLVGIHHFRRRFN